jgi:hypothetical protein
MSRDFWRGFGIGAAVVALITFIISKIRNG